MYFAFLKKVLISTENVKVILTGSREKRQGIQEKKNNNQLKQDFHTLLEIQEFTKEMAIRYLLVKDHETKHL